MKSFCFSMRTIRNISSIDNITCCIQFKTVFPKFFLSGRIDPERVNEQIVVEFIMFDIVDVFIIIDSEIRPLAIFTINIFLHISAAVGERLIN